MTELYQKITSIPESDEIKASLTKLTEIIHQANVKADGKKF